MVVISYMSSVYLYSSLNSIFITLTSLQCPLKKVNGWLVLCLIATNIYSKSEHRVISHISMLFSISLLFWRLLNRLNCWCRWYCPDLSDNWFIHPMNNAIPILFQIFSFMCRKHLMLSLLLSQFSSCIRVLSQEF